MSPSTRPIGRSSGRKGWRTRWAAWRSPRGPEWKPPDAFARELSQAHVRYLVAVGEDVDTTIHLPFWMPMFGVAACEHKTTLEARVWELPPPPWRKSGGP